VSQHSLESSLNGHAAHAGLRFCVWLGNQRCACIWGENTHAYWKLCCSGWWDHNKHAMGFGTSPIRAAWEACGTCYSTFLFIAPVNSRFGEAILCCCCTGVCHMGAGDCRHGAVFVTCGAVFVYGIHCASHCGRCTWRGDVCFVLQIIKPLCQDGSLWIRRLVHGSGWKLKGP
jgi:hypothetical protein